MFTLLGAHRLELAILFGLSVFSVASDIGTAYITKYLIDGLVNAFRVGEAIQASFLVFSAVGIFVAYTLAQGSQLLYGFRLYDLGTRLKDELREKTYAHYLSLHALYHQHASSGEVMSRIERGADGLLNVVQNVIGWNVFPPLIKFSGVFAVLMWYSPVIAITVLAPLPIYLFVVKMMTSRIELVERKCSEKMEQFSKHAHDVAGNVLTVKKFARESSELQESMRLLTDARDEDMASERLWFILQGSETIISAFGRLFVLGISGMMIMRGALSIGELVFFLSLQQMAYGPLTSIAYAFPRYRKNMTRVERAFGLLEEKVQVTDAPEATTLPPHERDIVYDHVTFSYHRDGKSVLKDVSVTLPAGKTIALVGRSGSGKTTFVNLLMRSFDPAQGTIAIDGHDIARVTRSSLLNQMAVVPQEVDLFSRSVRDNIAYGLPKCTKAQIEQAAKLALAHEFILSTEKGYDTPVGSRGLKLSGGERQRIGIARAILRNPRILILDEATSHLDTESERLIGEATDNLVKGRTTFIIAHRLSTILHADIILVFANGSIEAQGTHRQLLRKSETYRLLSKAQFRDKE